MRFQDIPIMYITVTKNNTKMVLTNGKDPKTLCIHSCGREGFKNCRKGTNVAAQATGIAMSRKTVNQGIKTIRICIKGLGPGRMSSIKGLQMGGLNIVSISDHTPISEPVWPRPPAARSI